MKLGSGNVYIVDIGKKNKKNGRLVVILKQNKGLLSLFKKYYKIYFYSEINIKNFILV